MVARRVGVRGARAGCGWAAAAAPAPVIILLTIPLDSHGRLGKPPSVRASDELSQSAVLTAFGFLLSAGPHHHSARQITIK